MTGRFHAMPFGAQAEGDDRVRFRLWAPDAGRVELLLDDAPAQPMTLRDGWAELAVRAAIGARYAFRIDGEQVVPDPASRAQAGDVSDRSVVVDPRAYDWRDGEWRGRPWHETVLLEVHAGVLGGFAGVRERLVGWRDIGITAIELMPVAEFVGARNWGYDGVLPFAVESSYGGPDALKRLVDEAHSLGLMVFLDVVYNHFGPEGNFLPVYARRFFRGDAATPWGQAIAFDLPEVREFFIENACYWIEELHLDGLRFDAVHAIRDRAFLEQLASRVRTTAGDRHVHLVLENDDNEAPLLRTAYDAQWNDDWHHAMHVLLTREREGYYGDYADAPARHLARCFAEGFAWQGEPSAHRDGARRGTPSGALPPTAFVCFLQNHDQVGNRAFGERLATLADPDALRAAQVALLLAPHVPLLFLGEECGAREPFLYFTDHPPALGDAVREGRRREFARFAAFADECARESIPDPNDESTFERSRPSHTGDTAFVRELLATRRREISPRLVGAR
ncbi:MAG TPA: malto-oligosyltrehalose trehalohydrolase, partial [Xanthomonadales bacterium]|nr:malto-oligosyltrehalose trehalohydrolase [Xanthomonadales bacterium]